MFLNMLGFLIRLDKNNDDWISLEYARICLEYNVKDARKLLYKLDTIYKREPHAELYQTSRMELLWKYLIWYCENALESEYALWYKNAMVLNMSRMNMRA